jgi:hypothetical protein
VPRIQSARSWTEAVQQAQGATARALANRTVAVPVEEHLVLPPDVKAEVRRIADRFGAEPSAVLSLAWLLARSSL